MKSSGQEIFNWDQEKMVRIKRIKWDIWAMRGKLNERSIGPQHAFIWSTGPNQYRRNKQISMNVRTLSHTQIEKDMFTGNGLAGIRLGKTTRNHYWTLLCGTTSWFNVHYQSLLLCLHFYTQTNKIYLLQSISALIYWDGSAQAIKSFPHCRKKSV